MFKSIVVGTDGSSRARQAVASAAELAKVHGATLHLVRAFRPASSSIAMAGEAMMTLDPSLDSEVQADVEKELERAAAEVARSGVAAETYACPQGAVSAILSVAAHQNADLIVVGSKGMHGARRVLGSIPNSIAHQADRAVLIVPTA